MDVYNPFLTVLLYAEEERLNKRSFSVSFFRVISVQPFLNNARCMAIFCGYICLYTQQILTLRAINHLFMRAIYLSSKLCPSAYRSVQYRSKVSYHPLAISSRETRLSSRESLKKL